MLVDCKERDLAWKQFAESLNALPEPTFRVTSRSVRDLFIKLLDNFTKNEHREKASGIENAEYNMVNRGLHDMTERMEESKLLLEET